MGKFKYLLIFFILLSFSILAVSASDINDNLAADSENQMELENIEDSSLDAQAEIDEDANLGAKTSMNEDIISSSTNDQKRLSSSSDSNAGIKNSVNNTTDTNKTTVKTTPKILLKTKKIYTNDYLKISLKNSKNKGLKNKKLKISIKKKNYYATTDSKGMAKLKLFLPAKSYIVKIKFLGDEEYEKVSKDFNIKTYKLSSKFKPYSNQITKNSNLYYYLLDKKGQPITKKKIILKLKGKTYQRTTNKNGRIQIKIGLNEGDYILYLKSKADKYYKGISKSYKFYVRNSIKFTVGNKKLLSNGYLRIYLRSNAKSEIYNKKFTITIGKKKFTKYTNGEGNIVFKPKMDPKNYTLTVQQGKYYVSKKIRCIKGNAKDPLKEIIPLVNGEPDLDSMLGSYVLGDGSARYTVTRSQYKEVIDRDSRCLFLNNRLSRYVFFKTKSHPNTNHVIKREKWNVLERELNRELVSANKKSYWPSEITASLAGKSYTYSEVRDVQNTGLTCGPTAASVCTQALRNYLSERLIAKLSKTDKLGTTCNNMKSALDNNNFNCTCYYEDSFEQALKELEKGGTALIFHTRNHYVSMIDISKDGKMVLVSNPYGEYDNGYNKVPTNWVKISYMKTKFVKEDVGLIIKLHYDLCEEEQESLNCFYNSMGTNWNRQNTNQRIPNG